MSPTVLGTPRLHLRATDSTNVRAVALAGAGAPHGTLVTAGEQAAGRGRQGRSWSAPAGQALLMSLVLREPPALLPLAAALAVADTADVTVGGDRAVTIKWPNDVLLDGGKAAGILVEGRPQEGWAILGIGMNVAVRIEHLPAELRDRAATLGRTPADVEPTLSTLLDRLTARLAQPAAPLLDDYRARDALAGRTIRWSGGEGNARGVDGSGRLIVHTPTGERVTLESGEVHLGS